MIPWYLNHDKYGKTPWAVQTEALRLSEGQKRYAYYLEQGLGKTALTLNDFMHHFKRYKVNLMLVICPNSFKLDWKNTPKEWGINLRTGMWPLDRAEKCDLYAINYEAVRTEAGEKYLNEILKTRRVFLVFDESSKLGSPKTQQTKKSILLSRTKGIEIVRCLDGTPRTSSVLNYYGPLKTLNQLNGMTSTGFRNRFSVSGGYQGRKIVASQNEDELAAILAKCSFRALKKDWRADLPPRIFKTLPIGMTKKQYGHYKEMKEEFSTVIRIERITANLVLTQLAKLRQISSCLLLDSGEAFRIEKPENSPKIKAMFEIMEGHDDKTIIVYYYKETGKMLEEALAKRNMKCSLLHGNMQPEFLKDQKQEFNEGENNIILCQQNAACLGHTLIGNASKRANHMIFMENSFSLRDRLQMLDRNHRGEMDQTCLVYDLVSSDIERKIIDGLNRNKQAADFLDDLVISLQQLDDNIAGTID
jgi:hypothetical protein